MPRDLRSAKRKRPAVTETSSAAAICNAFFDAIDLDGDEFIVEEEAKKISTKAFGEDSMAAARRWSNMLREMDKNGDRKISRDEYRQWWTAKVADKMQKDGHFAPDYTTYLLNRLERLMK